MSNARRIGFTALALVAFWILTWAEYSLACNDACLGSFWLDITDFGFEWYRNPSDPHSVYLAASMAVVPMVFLTVSVSNSLPRPKDTWMAVSAALTVTTILFARWLGLGDPWIDAHIEDALSVVQTRFENHDRGILEKMDPHEFGQQFARLGLGHRDQFSSELAARHEATWPWLLLPLTLTTAFVIFGAWRRAVRDADVEVVGEDE